MKRSGRLVCAASDVTEIEDVLLARGTPGRRSVGFVEDADFQFQTLGNGFDGEIGVGE